MARADRDRWLALALLLAVIGLVYLLLVHPLFTVPLREADARIAELRERDARVRSLLRRGPPRETEHFEVADLQLDLLKRKVTRSGERLNLTNKEFALLHLLLSRQGEVLSRSLIASHVWQMNFDSDTNVVDVAIRRLRAKVDDPYPLKLIHTVRGIGRERSKD